MIPVEVRFASATHWMLASLEQELRRQGSTLATLHTQTRTEGWNSSGPGSCPRGTMKCRHKPSTVQKHHELFPINTGAMRCLAKPLRGSITTKKASDFTTRPNRLHTHAHLPRRLAHPRSSMPPLSTLPARATHALPLHPAALASVPYGVVLVRVRIGHFSDPLREYVAG